MASLPPDRPTSSGSSPVDPDLDPLAKRTDAYYDRQFEQDLELAKRLSLETSRKEQEERQRFREFMDLNKESENKADKEQTWNMTSATKKPSLLRSNTAEPFRSSISRPRPDRRPSDIGKAALLPPPPPSITGPPKNSRRSKIARENQITPDFQNSSQGVSGGDLMSFSPMAKSDVRAALSDLYNQPPSLVPPPRTVFPVLDQQNNVLYYPQPKQSDAFGSNFDFRFQGSNNFGSLLGPIASRQGQGMVKSQSWCEAKPLEEKPKLNPTLGIAWQPQKISGTKVKSKSSTNGPVRGSNSDFGLKEKAKTKAKDDSCLIDFSSDHVSAKQRLFEKKLTRVSVLEAFDPLLGDRNLEHIDSDDLQEEAQYYASTMSDNSFYESYDPFEYLNESKDDLEDHQDEVFETWDEKPSEINLTPSRATLRKHTRNTSVTEAADSQTLARRKKQKADYEEVIRKGNESQVAVSISEKLSDILNKERDVTVDGEIIAFTQMVSDVRGRFKYNDSKSNQGYVTSAFIKSVYPANTSVKMSVHTEFRSSPLIFTSDVSSVVEMIVMEVVCNVDADGRNPEDFYLQVAKTSEYLDPKSQLKDYEYVHQCYKFDRDLEFVLVAVEDLQTPYLRTIEDDELDILVKVEDISPKDQIRKLSYNELKILVETLEGECDRMKQSLQKSSLVEDRDLSAKPILQAVKAICAFLGQIETLEITEVCEQFQKNCETFVNTKNCGQANSSCDQLRPEILEQVGDRYATVILKNVGHQLEEQAVEILKNMTRLKEVVQKQIEIYAKTFRVNFSLTKPEASTAAPKESNEVFETFLVRICALHRLKPTWDFDSYQVTLQIYHGSRPLADVDPVSTEYTFKSYDFYERVKFDAWIEIKSVRICSLPREARLVFTLTGKKTDHSKDKPRITRTEIGWGALQLYSYERFLAQGTFLLSLWPRQAEKQIGPAPDSGSHPGANDCPVLSVELPELSTPVIFPDKIPIHVASDQDYNFKDLLYDEQQHLLDICDQDIFTFMELRTDEREMLWEKRHYLKGIPGALPKVLLAVRSWEYSTLPSLYGLLHSWKRPKPIDILQLFLPCFPDIQVRQCAIEWLSDVHSDELVDYLPQLLEALKHETWSVSPLTELLLQRSLQSPRVAHNIYWLLVQSLPGMTPQNTTDAPHSGNTPIKVARYRRRLQMLMRSLYTISGQAMRNSFCKQQELLKYLNDAALEVQAKTESSRHLTLKRSMENLDNHLNANVTPIPLSPSLIADGIEVKSCSYFPSKTVPLKVAFTTGGYSTCDLTSTHCVNETDSQMKRQSASSIKSSDSGKSYENPGPTSSMPVIYKVGDDLRQDQLTIQMIRVMDKLWLSENLDMKMVTFSCVPTGDKQGMVEMVTEAKTLREIQVTSGVTGSFRETSISSWLEKNNQTQLEFTRAVENFTRSCAGYSIATYLLGICDRHNDNIMIKTSGHLFHIDFGKFLGDAERFGSFKRDRSPFVLSPDMVYVINGGNKPTQKFHEFVDLCCKGFNIIRKNGTLLLNLFALMASSGIPGVTMDAVRYVQRALLPDLSPTEAAATFSRMIEESLSSWFVQWNFFIHNLGQMRFNEESGETGELLSFVPKRYSMETDGRITAVQVYAVQKRYTPEKHYVFILKISREGIKDPTILFRTFKEFCELDFKLSTQFPHVDHIPSLRKSGFNIGRQEIWEVAQRRKHDIARFLETLFYCPDSIAHSDLVYTFFHPMLRDQEEADIHNRKLKERKNSRRASGRIQGELKLSLEYRKDTLYVMVCHARDITMPDGSKEEPNSYVKVYLLPDPQKFTKRKTKVVRKNCFPSFMEMLEYRMALETVKCRTLQATLWACDRFQENLFLGAVTIPLESVDLAKETTKWYKLGNFQTLSSNYA